MKWFIASLGLLSQLAIASEPPELSRFEKEVSDGEARVRTDSKLPSQAWQKACRSALTLPLRAEVRERLSERVGLSVPGEVSFLRADIEKFNSWNESGWLHCTGESQVSDWSLNIAGLSVRAAWFLVEQGELEQIKPFLKEALSHSYSSADAVALIAKLAPEEQRLGYLDTNLNDSALIMNAAKYAVSSIWFSDGRWQSVIDLTSSCDSVECRQLKLNAEEQKEREDAEKADDLSSYF
ncbi:hypothetical protein AWR38_10580 [Idiomarina sp. WRN-38]|uniref:hypothetical protein n=1 Tax=Idiomarina sp. OXR-189 TaxID=3100175 RepID=UPI0007337CA1|nr:hypothetical protein [Idiomarina sp. OXR-189]KTG30103.1 hypothetical protein AUR68_10565 [Idiomarina sp. H105]OAF14496.1 hypothetical protein AWR38_10580 [Idiomarina sp. WRN-38]WPZ01979.1 hypothetical protein UM402_03465 [Idiomarina sp. OXR-189]|tara:strand:- start:2202 stop:2915 length:714 start_codon:yes stop_codon:yes gene_type:complete